MKTSALIDSKNYVSNLFFEYYTKDLKTVQLPRLMENREFAFILFRESVMLRHKRFENKNDLMKFIRNIVPSDIYYSCAYYNNPEVAMDEKEWQGADLVFDIDADHLSSPCKKVHDELICRNCGFVAKGIVPHSCPACENTKFNVKTWPCEVCLENAKTETVKLLDILLHDFGFSEHVMRVFFSGHRGYHVHVENGTVKSLDTHARKEIVDYISGVGLDIFLGQSNKKNWDRVHPNIPPRLMNFGWYKRLAFEMKNFILNAREEDLRALGLKTNVISAILENKDLLLNGWLTHGNLSVIKGVGFRSWKKIAKHSARLQSAQIDTVVTTDIHRLIRLTGTLHSKTGFKKVNFPISKIDDFDPFKHSLALKKGTITVYISDAPEFRVGDEFFGPYKNNKVELPTAAAVLLICRNRAEVTK